MNDKKQKLELTWIGKEDRPRLEPRILLEDPEKSYRKPTPTPPKEGITRPFHEENIPSQEGNIAPSPSRDGNSTTPIPSLEGNKKGWVDDKDIFDNRLIFGDNLLALKALEQEFAGKIKCVFIDPPYNTGSAFTHYDDGLEHSIWLSLIRDRLELIHTLLSNDGSLWITIDDNEAHYLKVLCDEIFGRAHFVANVVWEKVYTPKSNGRGLSADHDHTYIGL